MKKEREEAAEKVRDEGLYNKDKEQADGSEIDLEIEAPGSANAVAEEGSLVIQNDEEFNKMKSNLIAARKKAGNKIGDGGQLIELKNPKEY